ncbi:bifunctional YncE family protein/alkaline phosphatase family protein [Zhouia sp. PK063]|uniref:bifunctional YncE family protein/alkaline phosphatase family protein n=1 Tax=Zhouia sp. PK063 TaxID=3373602 RepID=UPI0037AACF65
MKTTIKQLFIFCGVLLSFYINAQTPGKISNTSTVLLPNGWKLSPAGKAIQLDDLPLHMKLSPKGNYLAVTNNGQSTQSVQLIAPNSEKQLDQQTMRKSWYGLDFSSNEKHLYVAGGNDNFIVDFGIDHKKLIARDTIVLGQPWPKEKICPTGIAVNSKRNILYAVTKEDNSLYEVDLKTKQILHKVALPDMAYSCILSPNLKTLYISIWGSNIVQVYDTQQHVIKTSIVTGSHPNELLLTKKGDVLYVANANDNTVSVIATKTLKVAETLSAALYPTHLTGSTTNGLALSANEKTLYIANADNNCLAVFDVSIFGKSKSKGFIPTGWYPTNVITYKHKILVSNGKGFTSMANPNGPQPISKKDNSGYQKGSSSNKKLQYIAGLFKGTLSFIDEPTATQLKNYTKSVYANTPFTTEKEKVAAGIAGNPIPRKPGDVSPIKYVFYIIKENRTYDQVLGDVKEGNGDASLCLFGENVTPNHHKIAKDFVLLDNFYVDAEVSADGHNWSTAAYATDVVEKTWPTSYGRRGGSYFYEGQNKAAYPRDGFIWDYCKRAGISYRSYGEFGAFGKANIKALEGHMGPHSPGFNLDIKDQVRADAWIADFDSLVAIHKVPQFSTIRISNDHTSGQKLGKISPLAAVADNDLAIGRILDHLSHSPVWKQSVVFILEDDAQNGPDHVDAHRSPVFVAGPYVKRNAVIHHMYSTSGVLRTIELILGLSPMSQYDAAALPLYDCFTATPDFSSYTFSPANIDLNTKNVAINSSSKMSEKFDFSKEDAVPDLALSEVVWKAIKGEQSVMPAPKRSAFVILEDKKDDDDDE